MSDKIYKILDMRVTKIVAMIGYFLLLFAWSMKEPFGSCPDEAMRYQIPEFIFNNGRLPTLYDSSIWTAAFGFSYAGQPNLPYIIGALFMKIAWMIGVEPTKLYMAVRLVSILSGVLFAYLVEKIADELFENKNSKYTMVGMAALLPQACFVFSYVNCDALAMAGVAMVVLAWLKGVKNQWTIKNCIFLALGLVVIALSYLNTYGYILMSIIVFVLTFITVYQGENRYKKMVSMGMIVVVIALALAGWFFIRNYMLYHTLFGDNIMEQLSNKYALEEYTIAARKAHAIEQMTTLKGIAVWFQITFYSFFGIFGGMDITYPFFLYEYIVFGEIILFCLAMKNRVSFFKKAQWSERIIQIGLFGGALITLILSLIYSISDYQPQGRYILPMVIPFVYYMTVGLEEFTRVTNIKIRFQPLLVIGFFLAADLYAINVLL